MHAGVSRASVLSPVSSQLLLLRRTKKCNYLHGRLFGCYKSCVFRLIGRFWPRFCCLLTKNFTIQLFHLLIVKRFSVFNPKTPYLCTINTPIAVMCGPICPNAGCVFAKNSILYGFNQKRVNSETSMDTNCQVFCRQG